MAWICLLQGNVFAQRTEYKDAASQCDEEVATTIKSLGKEYAGELDKLRDTFRLSGSLEKTLAVKKEQGAFQRKESEQRGLCYLPVELRRLQEKYPIAPMKTSEKIAKHYLATLEETKRGCSIEDKLDDAIVVQKEIDKIQKKYGIVNPAHGAEATLPSFQSVSP